MYALFCTEFYETHKCSRTLHGDLLCRIASKTVKKYGNHRQKLIYSKICYFEALALASGTYYAARSSGGESEYVQATVAVLFSTP
jgi:hypothetical protein